MEGWFIEIIMLSLAFPTGLSSRSSVATERLGGWGLQTKIVLLWARLTGTEVITEGFEEVFAFYRSGTICPLSRTKYKQINKTYALIDLLSRGLVNADVNFKNIANAIYKVHTCSFSHDTFSV